MRVSDKIKLLRDLKGWSREEMAYRLKMSVSNYGSIERGDTDVKLSQLEKIAEIFEIDLAELFNLNDKIIFQSVGNGNSHLTNVNSSCGGNERQQLIIEQQARENELLKQQNVILEQYIKDLRIIIDLLQKV